MRRTSFAPPPSFRLAKYLQGAFGVHVGTEQHDVIVEFTKARATYVTSRIWHESQSIELLADGRVRLRFTCTNLLPVVSWVLEWGPHARTRDRAGMDEFLTKPIRPVDVWAAIDRVLDGR